jgi:hypothetical protein
MKISKYRNSKWLRKDDVEGMSVSQRTTTVASIAEEEVGDDTKPVLYLKGIEKGWPINITGLETLAELAESDDTDDFVGIAVEIFVDPNVRYAGKKIGGIKLRAAEPVKQEATADAGAPFDDDIPW